MGMCVGMFLNYGVWGRWGNVWNYVGHMYLRVKEKIFCCVFHTRTALCCLSAIFSGVKCITSVPSSCSLSVCV